MASFICYIIQSIIRSLAHHYREPCFANCGGGFGGNTLQRTVSITRENFDSKQNRQIDDFVEKQALKSTSLRARGAEDIHLRSFP